MGSGPHGGSLGTSLATWFFNVGRWDCIVSKFQSGKIQTLRVNLHFKIAVFGGNYAINEKPVWSSGFSLYVSFGKSRSLF